MDNNVISTLVDNYTQKIDHQPIPETTTPIEKGLELVDKPLITDELPITEYEAIKGIPYAAKYFGIDYWDQLKISGKIDVTGVFKGVVNIDNYIKNKIINDGLKNTENTYKELMTRLKSQIGITGLELSERIIPKISQYVEILNRQDELDRKMKRLIYE